MKLVAYETGRTSLLFPLEEISPLVPVDGRLVVEGIAGRYNFRAFPAANTPQEELAKTGVRFENGLFSVAGKLINIANFTTFNDGIVVNSNTTEGASAFIDDILPFLRGQFGFRDFISKPQRAFVSQLIVEFDQPLSGLLSTFGKISKLVSDQVNRTFGLSAQMNFARLDFEIDKVSNHLRYIVPRFMIERRPGVPFTQERYICSAPMHTQHHLEILAEIEKMARAK